MKYRKRQIGQVIEEKQQLSSSVIWELQRKFYILKGIEAWREKIVPNFITTNTWIAKAYARIVIGYLTDLYLGPILGSKIGSSLGHEVIDFSEPVYLIEFGASMGRFCFYFLNVFYEMLHQIPYLSNLKIRYILTDCVQENLEYCLAHPSLKEYIKQGIVDAAVFNSGEIPNSLKLLHSGVTLSSILNPIVMLANYFFCVVEQDAFMVDSNGNLYEALITITSTREIEEDLSDPNIISRSKKTFEYKPIPDILNHYKEPEFNRILKKYVEYLSSFETMNGKDKIRSGTSFLMPIGAARCVNMITNLSAKKDYCLLLCSDKGYSHLNEFEGRVGYPMSNEGSFSFMANLHALGWYFKEIGGDSLHSSQTVEIQGDICLASCIFWLGNESYTHLKIAFKEYLDQFGPVDFFHIVNLVTLMNAENNKTMVAKECEVMDCDEYLKENESKDKQQILNLNENTYESIHGVAVSVDYLKQYKMDEKSNKNTLSLQQVHALWKLNEYEPYFFWLISEHLLYLLNNLATEEKMETEKALLRTYMNFYFIGEEEDILFELGRCAYQLRIPQHKNAIKFYKQSIKLFGKHYITYYNIGLCYRENENIEKAKYYFVKTLELEESYEPAGKALNELNFTI